MTILLTFKDLKREVENQEVEFNADQKQWLYKLLERLVDLEDYMEERLTNLERKISGSNET